MMVFAYPTSYAGDDFGNLPVYQAGRYKLVQIIDTVPVPVDVAILCAYARQTGAQWLLIDPNADDNSAFWFDTERVAA